MSQRPIPKRIHGRRVGVFETACPRPRSSRGTCAGKRPDAHPHGDHGFASQRIGEALAAAATGIDRPDATTLIATSIETRVNFSRLSAPNTIPSPPRRVAANADTTVVVWENRGRIHYRLFGAVNTGERAIPRRGSAHHGEPTVAMAEDGSFVIIWIADRADGATDVHALRFRADGSAVDTPPRAPPPWLLTPGEFRLNATGVGRNLDPAVAMARDGRFVVCWSNLADGNTLALRRFDADGTPAAGIETFVQGLSNDNTLSHGRLAWDPNPDKLEARDRIALSFLEPLGSRRHLVFVGLDSRLRPLNAQVALSPENGGELIEGNLAINHAGQVVLAGICTQPGGRSVLVGQGLLFDPMSAPVATRLENTDMSPPFLYGGECGLDLALGCDERIVLTWQANDIGNPGASSVFLREMTPDLGVVTPAPLRAPETLTGSQRAPSIALWAGSGALVWSGHGERPGQSDPAGNFVRGLLLGAPDKPVAEHAVAISPFDAAGRGSEPSPAVDAARSNDLEEVGA